MIEVNKIYQGNCLHLLSKMKHESVDLVITSPPYSNMRSYNGYHFDFEGIASRLTDVLKPGGVIVWVVNDQYVQGSRDLSTAKQSIFFVEECGLRLHDHMVFHKSAFQFPSNNRYHQCWESMLVFSKGKPKTFNPLKDKPNKYPGQKPHGVQRDKDGTMRERLKKEYKPINEFGQRTNVWHFTVGGGHLSKDKTVHKHPAAFSEDLAADHIKSWSNPGDLILDPMAGSGTSGLAAQELGRNFVLCDTSLEYCQLMQQRFSDRFELDLEIESLNPSIGQITSDFSQFAKSLDSISAKIVARSGYSPK